MKKSKIISAVLSAAVFTSVIMPVMPISANAAETLPYQNTSLSFEERAADLVSRMTLAEKAAQTGNSVGKIDRLGVSKYNYWKEGLHGVARQGAATSFPTSLSLSNTWDRQLMYEVMDITSTEARGKNNKTDLSYWNPTINMARDPRWGRNEESYGEDPYLTAELGSKAVEGMQGNDEKYLKTISTLKHFAANNVEGERFRGTSIMTDKTLREYYTKAFKDIIETADPGSVMSSYNAETISRNGETIVNYTPSSANKYLLTDLLRRSWGFSGYVVGDCSAFANLYSMPSMRRNLFPDMDYADITAEMTTSTAFKAGADLDCGHAAQSDVYGAVEQEYLSEDTLDVSLYRLFLARMRTGEFDGDNIPYRNIKSNVIETDEHVAKAEQAAEESWVLLENKNNTLPIKNDVTKVAVVGSFADKLVLGDYSSEPTKNTTPIDGITAELKKINPNVDVNYLGTINNDTKLFNVKSINFVLKNGTKRPIDISQAESVTGMMKDGGKLIDVTPQAKAIIRNVDFTDVVSVEVEMATGSRIGGALSVSYGGLGGQPVATVNTTATKDENTYVTCSGECTAEAGGYTGVTDMAISVSAKIGEFSVESYKTQLDAADYIIAYAATIPKQDGLGSQDASESHDRSSIDLPAHESHVQAIADVAEYANKTIVAMSTTGQINVEDFKDKCAALLWTSYNGQTQGEALGKVLTGAVNPSGRLSTTWYAASDLEKMPLGSNKINDNKIGATYYYTNYEIAQAENYPGRTYQYYSGEAVYPFGYGKSYTNFVISNIKADKTSVDANGTVTISVDVENTGEVAGTAVPQLYITVPGADGKNLPLKQLKGFERVTLNAGEKKTVNFKLNIADVNFYDEQTMKNYVVNGEYTAKVAADADDAGVSTKFSVTGELSDALKNVTAVPTGIRLIGVKEGGNVVSANSIDASASAALANDYVINDLSSMSDATVTYTSSNTNVANVSSSGVVTAGNTEGTATITVSVTRNGITKTDTFPVVTQFKTKVTDARKAEILAELEDAYKACYAPSYSEKNYEKLTAIYEQYKARIEKSILADENETFIASALKKIASIPVNEMKIKNDKNGKIKVTVPYDSAALIEAKYDGKKLAAVKLNEITEEGDITLEGYEENDEVMLMLWDSISTMKPLLPVKKHKYNAPEQLNKILFNFSDPAFDSFYGTTNGQELTSDTGMNGFGGWETGGSSKTVQYDGETYTFTRALKAGAGSETQSCVYFTPETDGMVTVFFAAAAGRIVYVQQNDHKENKSGDGDSVITTLEVNVTAGEPVYIYGGGANKFIYGVLFRVAGTFTPTTPPPTEEPMPEIAEREKIECENYVKAWTNRMTTSDVTDASEGKLIDNTKDGDIIYMGARNVDNLAGIELMAGTKESSAAVEFFAVDMTGRDVNSMSQKDADALLTTANSIGKTSLKSSNGWNNLFPVTARVKTDKSGMMGIFMKCSTGASFCGNLDYIELMYAAEQTASIMAANLDTIDWNGAEVALAGNRVIQVIGGSVTVDITPESFAQSELEDGDSVVLNSMLAVDDQLYIGCDGGYLITMTPCSKCSVIRKACDFDIKSLEYKEDSLILIGKKETLTISDADARGYSISRETAIEMAENGAVLVDVRTQEEYAKDAMDGAINVPLDSFAQWIESQNDDVTVIVYCSTGKRAEAALLQAVEAGHTKIYAVK